MTVHVSDNLARFTHIETGAARTIKVPVSGSPEADQEVETELNAVRAIYEARKNLSIKQRERVDRIVNELLAAFGPAS